MSSPGIQAFRRSQGVSHVALQMNSYLVKLVCMEPAFKWITLGVGGGMYENNLSAHLLAPIGQTDFVCLDAGTVASGLGLAAEKGCFRDIAPQEGLTVEGTVLHNHVKAYLVSHPYLDHVEGLVAVSPNDGPKPILSMAGVIADMQSHVFNWRIWPNMCDRGEEPAIGQYRYVELEKGKSHRINGTGMSVQAYPLAHGTHTDSVAFLIESRGRYVLYMGDTGPDEVEKRTTTEDVFKRMAPLIREGVFHGLSIEASYTDERPDDMLYSHLTPKWIMKALHKLALLVDGKNPSSAIRGLKVLITHIKPDFSSGPSVRKRVISQINEQNNLGIDFIFLEEGTTYEL